MSSIQQILASILNAVYGKDVRQAIHDGVEMAYDKADDAATSAAAAAEAASGSQESAASSAQAAADSASSASDFADAAEQYKNEAFHTTPAGYEDFVNQVNSSLDYLAETGVKNLLNFDTASVTIPSSGSITNNDGIITVDGVFSANYWFTKTIHLKEGKYKLSGCPSGGSQSTTAGSGAYCLYVSQGNENKFDVGNGAEFTLSSEQDVIVTIRVIDGTHSNEVFKPMVTLASFSNSDYAHFVPYAKANDKLTEQTNSKLLNSDITLKDATSISDLMLYKTGNIVHVNGYIAATFTANTGLTVCEFPQECIPRGNHPVRFLCAVGDNAYSPAANVGYGVVDGTGKLKITTTLSGAKAAYFCISYIAKEA